MSIKILSTADLHLGKSSSGIPVNADEISTKFTWKRIVDYSIENSIDILLLAGDIVDRDNRYYEAVGQLETGFKRLKEAGITVFVVAGNHDFDVFPQIVKSRQFNNVELLGFNGEWELKKFSKNGKEIQFIGWSFSQQYIREDPLIAFNLDTIDPTIPAIGLLHGEAGIRDSKYAPIDIKNLENKPVTAWILGHIHKPQELKKNSPLIWYPGSPHAMSAKETGMHGPLLLTIEKDTIQALTIPLSPVRYRTIDISVTNTIDENGLRDKITSSIFTDTSDILEELENVSFLVYDISLTGEHSRINEADHWAQPIKDNLDLDLESGTKVSVRKVINNIIPAIGDLSRLAADPTPAGILAESILAIQNGESTDFLKELSVKFIRQTNEINNSGTYQALRSSGKLNELTNESVNEMLLKECKRLLAELLSQQE
ncbi:MAG: DNA repair exonuclease [Bacteroidales bacterium]|nr:DNA repair exonuclease [Bacteroidales bacterium]